MPYPWHSPYVQPYQQPSLGYATCLGQISIVLWKDELRRRTYVALQNTHSHVVQNDRKFTDEECVREWQRGYSGAKVNRAYRACVVQPSKAVRSCYLVIDPMRHPYVRIIPVTCFVVDAIYMCGQVQPPTSVLEWGQRRYEVQWLWTNCSTSSAGTCLPAACTYARGTRRT